MVSFAQLRWFPALSSGIFIACSLYAGLVYRGKAGERYSPLNHFISELGELGTSRGARIFNGGLLTGGVLLIPFFLGLGILLHSVLGWMGTVSGIACAAACALVGCFPMNNLKPHTLVAVAFFRFGLVTMLLFGIALLIQPAASLILPRWLGAAGLLGALSYASFLFAFKPKPKETAPETGAPTEAENPLDPDWQMDRPRVWRLCVLEWAIFGVNVVWFLLVVAEATG
ncbi:MAG: DUF998 domain-containing protein [Anaerolineae bacterium]